MIKKQPSGHLYETRRVCAGIDPCSGVVTPQGLGPLCRLLASYTFPDGLGSVLGALLGMIFCVPRTEALNNIAVLQLPKRTPDHVENDSNLYNRSISVLDPAPGQFWRSKGEGPIWSI